jgi:hypothetical protein
MGRPGDLLFECGGGREIRPPNDLTFSVGEAASLLIEKLQGGQQKVNIQLPMPKSQKQQAAEGFPSAQALCGRPLLPHVYSPWQGFHVHPRDFRIAW